MQQPATQERAARPTVTAAGDDVTERSKVRPGYRFASARLRERRLELALTMQQLAARSGVPAGTISDAERRKRRLSPADQERLAAVLEIPVNELTEAEPVEAVRAAAVEMYRTDLSASTRFVAEAFGVTAPTVNDWIRAAGLQPRSRAEASHRGREPGRARKRQELLDAAGGCGSPTCNDPDCTVQPGKCHADGCDQDAVLAPQTSRHWRWVKGQPTKFCSVTCVGRTGNRQGTEQLAADIAEYERQGYWTIPRAAQELLLSEPTLIRYLISGPNRRLPPQRVRAAHGPLLLIPIREAKRLAKARLTSDHWLVQIHNDPDEAARWEAKRSEACGRQLSVNQALAIRDKVERRNTIANKIRIDTGRPPSANALHTRWDLILLALQSENLETEPSELFGDVALLDWQQHPEDWPRERYPAKRDDLDDFADGYVRRAARDRVQKALQRLRTKLVS